MVRGNPKDPAVVNGWLWLTRLLAAATLAMLVMYVAWYLLRHSDFSNDDLDNFVLMQRKGFWGFLLTPADVHYVPLHRLLSWVVFHVAPMNFSMAIVVVIAFHIGTLAFLMRSFRLLQTGQLGVFIVCAYAASAMVIYGLLWWAHAEHRAPYVFLDVCAIYNYLAWIKNGRRSHLVFIALAFIAAFGFYEKAVLIPVHLLLIGYLADEQAFRLNARKFLLPPLLLLSGSVVYIIGYLIFNAGAVKSSPLLAIRADLEFVKAFSVAAFGLAVEDFHVIPLQGMSPWLWSLVITVAAMLAWSLWQGRGSWKVLLAAFLLLMLDYLPITLSNRGTWLGLQITHQTRFAYEELQVFVLLLGIWAARMGMVGAGGFYRKRTWMLGFALVLLYAGVNINYVRLGRHHVSGMLWVMDQSHRYLGNLRVGLAGLDGSKPEFENTSVPSYLSLFQITPDTRSLLPLFIPHARFDDMASPRYRVEDDGRVLLVQ